MNIKKNKSNTAPIILFVYNRPWHSRLTLEALRKNTFALESKLIIFSDAPKKDSDREKVTEVREYLKTVSGFAGVDIVYREKNLGLAASVTEGVTSVINKYGKAIILEDDIITGPGFLTYMNAALNKYKDQKDVWHISGYSQPIKSDGLGDAYFTGYMNCWGWATWADRWVHFEKDPEKLIKEFSWKDILKFNLGGTTNSWKQVVLNRKGRINTWAVFWYAAIFQRNGLCLNPSQTLTGNIGHDGSGIHCYYQPGEKDIISLKLSFNLPDEPAVSERGYKRIQWYYISQKKYLLNKAINKVSRRLWGRNLIR